jgi:hypothetical protein
MAKKIFVSYKYSDSKVLALTNYKETTVRHYVDELAMLLAEEDHIYKGEDDGESMATLADATIGSKLGDKIFDSSVTIVLISKGMKETYTAEKDQWIPWEISYSIKEQSRADSNSKTNALLAVVLPDENGSYSYFSTHDAECNCTNYKTQILFEILRRNMFNKKNSVTRDCNGKTIHDGYFSYIHTVQWNVFESNINKYIDIAIEIRKDINSYNIVKSIS